MIFCYNHPGVPAVMVVPWRLDGAPVEAAALCGKCVESHWAPEKKELPPPPPPPPDPDPPLQDDPNHARLVAIAEFFANEKPPEMRIAIQPAKVKCRECRAPAPVVEVGYTRYKIMARREFLCLDCAETLLALVFPMFRSAYGPQPSAPLGTSSTAPEERNGESDPLPT